MYRFYVYDQDVYEIQNNISEVDTIDVRDQLAAQCVLLDLLQKENSQ
jgi:hypothetical protein